jgi:glycogen synthase
MLPVIFYFQLHHPFLLHPERDKFLWDERNRELFMERAQLRYLPAIRTLTSLVTKYRDIKFTVSLSGTFLDQADLYQSEIIKALQDLLDAGRDGERVEFLDETHYHSLASLFEDPRKQEFRDQVSLHRDRLAKHFGTRPTAFRNTDLIFNNDIAAVVADMGYRAMLCETSEPNASSGKVYRARGTDLLVIPRNRELSDDVQIHFAQQRLTPREYLEHIVEREAGVVLLGYNLEHMDGLDGAGIHDFWKGLAETLPAFPDLEIVTPTQLALRFREADCPVLDIAAPANADRAAMKRQTGGWLDDPAQYDLFRDIEKMEDIARKAGGELLTHWRHLTASDHLYTIHQRTGRESSLCTYENPYGESLASAVHILTRKIDILTVTIFRFEILTRKERPAVLIITPETGRLPEDLGGLAKYISGKSGGQGEVISALCEGLTERGVDVHLAVLNLKKRFQRESKLSAQQWREVRYKIDPEKIHLVSSGVYSDLLSAYGGNPLLNAAEFQREIVNNVIKTVSAHHGGRLIVHTHDWMAGGIINAYLKARGVPVLHTVHNVFTGHVPLDMLFGVDLEDFSENIYYSEEYGRRCIDSQATAIKNATLINFVGEQFLKEVVYDYFMDRPLVPPGVRMEVKAKYFHGTAISIINAPPPYMYPERCDFCVEKFGPDDDVLGAKRINRVEFQKRMGLNVDADAILLFWPSRLDPTQKGVALLEQVAGPFAADHPDVQIAIVGDGVGSDRTHVDVLGRIAYASGGRIGYQPFSEELCMLGYAAASDVFGASLYEPCGQIDQVGNIFGATATNRDTGGYHDKIRELRLKSAGAPQDVGNGFLFRDYDARGLWYGLENSVRFHRRPPEIREPQIRRIMRETRQRYRLENMIAAYIRAYERINDGEPIV